MQKSKCTINLPLSQTPHMESIKPHLNVLKPNNRISSSPSETPYARRARVNKLKFTTSRKIQRILEEST